MSDLRSGSKYSRMQVDEIWEVEVTPEGDGKKCITRFKIIKKSVKEGGHLGARVLVISDSVDPCICSGTIFIDKKTLNQASIVEM